jgi:hypothetical protein
MSVLMVCSQVAVAAELSGPSTSPATPGLASKQLQKSGFRRSQDSLLFTQARAATKFSLPPCLFSTFPFVPRMTLSHPVAPRDPWYWQWMLHVPPLLSRLSLQAPTPHSLSLISIIDSYPTPYTHTPQTPPVLSPLLPSTRHPINIPLPSCYFTPQAPIMCLSQTHPDSYPTLSCLLSIKCRQNPPSNRRGAETRSCHLSPYSLAQKCASL